MCDVAQWSRHAEHDATETIALFAGIKRSKPLLSLDHCSGRSSGHSASARIPSDHQALRPLLFAAHLSVSTAKAEPDESSLTSHHVARQTMSQSSRIEAAGCEYDVCELERGNRVD
jgi:hypothetical protein